MLDIGSVKLSYKNLFIFNGILFLAPFTFGICFKGKAWSGHGDGDAIAKAPAGICACIGETKGFPQRKAEGLRPRLVPWKDHRLVISRSAALSPCPGGLRRIRPLRLFESEG